MCYHANKKNIKLVLQGRIACWADRLPEFDNSKMVCNYRKLITCMYRIHVRASHYKINPPLLITWTDWTECTDRLYRLPIQTVQTVCTDRLWFHLRIAWASVIVPSQWPLGHLVAVATYCLRHDPVFWFVKFCTVSYQLIDFTKHTHLLTNCTDRLYKQIGRLSQTDRNLFFFLNFSQ